MTRWRQTGIAPLLQELFAQIPPPVPRLHPKPSDVYRATVTNLHVAPNYPEARTEVAAILPGLIEGITVRENGAGHNVELTGDIVKLLMLAREAFLICPDKGGCGGSDLAEICNANARLVFAWWAEVARTPGLASTALQRFRPPAIADPVGAEFAAVARPGSGRGLADAIGQAAGCGSRFWQRGLRR